MTPHAQVEKRSGRLSMHIGTLPACFRSFRPIADDNINLVLQRPIRLELTWKEELMTILQTNLDVIRVCWDRWWRHAGDVETHNAAIFGSFCHDAHCSRFLAKEKSFE